MGLVGAWRRPLVASATRVARRAHRRGDWGQHHFLLGGFQAGGVWTTELPQDVSQWLGVALTYPGIRLLQLTPAIVVDSTRLPQPFHKDPADQMIVATARLHRCPLATADDKILEYIHVDTIDTRA